jgi:sigma-54 specific flagellar transcriptional regulator A
MLDQGTSVVVADRDKTTAEYTASLFNFLEITTYIAHDEESLAVLVAEHPHIVAIFVAADTRYEMLWSAVRALSDVALNCACFLIQRESVTAELPATLSTRLQGTISGAIGYKAVLGLIDEAKEYSRAASKRPGDSTARMLRALVGSSADIKNIRELVVQVADSDATVLITGESGTGKEVVARTLHNVSARGKGPFVPINCGAIPLELLESELFGHEKGAFTGAIGSRQGRFEMAEGGTLFLDEIGDMPMNMQVKLLRVLQERSFERVGGNKTIKTNVRIVAATHRNLEQMVKEGSFRVDLFYRLNVFPIEISPLRDRVEDIPLLVKSCIHKLELESRVPPKLSDNVLACLAKYYWPGNVREVFNLVERLTILFAGRTVNWGDLPDKFRPNHDWLAEQAEDAVPKQLPNSSSFLASSVSLPCDGIDLKPHLADIECDLMAQALEQSEWVVARAAKLLNLRRTTLVEKMRKFELSRPEEMSIF